MTLHLGEPVDSRVPFIRKLHDLDEARQHTVSGVRFKAYRRSGERLGDDLRAGDRVLAVRTLPLQTLLYPTKHAFNSACKVPVPYVVMTHRCLLVQVDTTSGIKNILFNPSDTLAAQQTPFFKRLIETYGETVSQKLLTKNFGSIESHLASYGLTCADIDVIAFDHFHTQDLRPLLGTTELDDHGQTMRARFPNAYLLAPKVEWDDWDNLHPMQQAWFIRDGKRGVPGGRVILTDNDLHLGHGCLLLKTPGHTSGNQTLFAYAEEGVFGCSENGCAPDNWAPYESRIPGLQAYARNYEVDVVLNANTPEMGAEQYNSMILERSIVDRVPSQPAFVQMFPSSEVTPSALAPGVFPSVVFKDRSSGVLRKRNKKQPAARAVSPA